MGKSGSGLWLTRLGSQALPLKDGARSITTLGNTHHSSPKVLAAILQQVLKLQEAGNGLVLKEVPAL